MSIVNPFRYIFRVKKLLEIYTGNSDTLICFIICFGGLLKEDGLVALTEGVEIEMARNRKFIIVHICSAGKGRNKKNHLLCGVVVMISDFAMGHQNRRLKKSVC